jgi:ABC-2 type transporter
MISIFRTIAALTRTVEQALSIAGILVLAIANYAGYSIPRSSMPPWFLWISYINPVSYAFESLMVNEFANQNVPCSQLVPPYPNANIQNQVCLVTGISVRFSNADTSRCCPWRVDCLWRSMAPIVVWVHTWSSLAQPWYYHRFLHLLHLYVPRRRGVEGPSPLPWRSPRVSAREGA